MSFAKNALFRRMEHGLLDRIDMWRQLPRMKPIEPDDRTFLAVFLHRRARGRRCNCRAEHECIFLQNRGELLAG